MKNSELGAIRAKAAIALFTGNADLWRQASEAFKLWRLK